MRNFIKNEPFFCFLCLFCFICLICCTYIDTSIPIETEVASPLLKVEIIPYKGSAFSFGMRMSKVIKWHKKRGHILVRAITDFHAYDGLNWKRNDIKEGLIYYYESYEDYQKDNKSPPANPSH